MKKGKAIDQVCNFKYLGSIIMECMTFITEIKAKTLLAKEGVNKIRKRLRGNSINNTEVGKVEDLESGTSIRKESVRCEAERLETGKEYKNLNKKKM